MTAVRKRVVVAIVSHAKMAESPAGLWNNENAGSLEKAERHWKPCVDYYRCKRLL